MPYQSHKPVVYRIVDEEEMPDGLVVTIKDWPGGHAEVLFRQGEVSPSLPDELTRQSNHLIVHGSWRQAWTEGERVEGQALGLLLGVNRWESVPSHLMPPGHIVFPIQEEGLCVWVVDEDCVSRKVRNDMNDMLLRMVGDGLWYQNWPKSRPLPAGHPALPDLAPSMPSPVLV
ncbi:hypothetical protein ABZT17_26740 [Streptomyces sp. NPDC005648]|uniref:hypothetical protein n=1 Tax=Streptomyces sp. NPDC005648 TaxID=3157044 RepID=UPI0033B6A618